jgi:hypothetical protein
VKRSFSSRYFATGAILLFAGSLAAWASPVGLDVSLTFFNDTATTEIYTVTAVITDLENEGVLSAPTIHVPRGEWGEVKSGTMGEEILLFKVQVSDNGSETSYKVELTREGEVVASQKATISLEQ